MDPKLKPAGRAIVTLPCGVAMIPAVEPLQDGEEVAPAEDSQAESTVKKEEKKKREKEKSNEAIQDEKPCQSRGQI